MHVSQETPEQTDLRLQRVLATTRLEVLEGEWWFDEFPLDRFAQRQRVDAIALVRDDDGWSQLVPVRAGDNPGERFCIWSCHFPRGVDNSGFVGWLASFIKARTGSGVLVVCGQDTARGGIYDYYGCPRSVRDAVLSEVRALAEHAHRPAVRAGTGVPSLHGVRMRAVVTGGAGEANADTLFTFAQQESTVSALYAGGTVRLGYLVGTLKSDRLEFRYAQVDRDGHVDGGHSVCDIARLADGRVRLVEHFQWESRVGSGTNVLEEVGE
jgi:uncharacterized protein DUF6196